MDLIKAIVKRRSIRNFKDKKIEKDDLLFLCELGMKAPSSGNLQDFRFIVSNDKKIINKLPAMCMDQSWIRKAGGLIVVCSQPEMQIKWFGENGRWFATQNAAAAAQNILLGAQKLGLGATWVSGFDKEKINDLFDIPKNARVEMIILIGYPQGKPEPKEENAIDVMVYFDSFGNDKADLLSYKKDYSEKLERFIEDQSEKSKTLGEKIKQLKENTITNIKKTIKK